MDKTISMHLSKLKKSDKKTLEVLGVVLWFVYSLLFMKLGLFLLYLVYFILKTASKPNSKTHIYAIYSFLSILTLYDLFLLSKEDTMLVLIFISSLIVTSYWFSLKNGLVSQLSVGFILLLVPMLLV